MFWSQPDQSSSGCESSDFSDPEDNWRRKHQKRRSSKPKNKSKNDWFSWWSQPPKSKNKGKKNRKKRKSSSCHPSSAQGWGVLLFSFLIIFYVGNFFYLLVIKDIDGEVPVPVVEENHSVSSERHSIPLTAPGHIGDGKKKFEDSSTNSEPVAADKQTQPQNEPAAAVAVAPVSHQAVPASTLSGSSSASSATNTKNSELGDSSFSKTVGNDQTAASEARPLGLHPMNRNMINLQVPGSTGKLSEDDVKGHYRKLAKAYLSSFTGGVHRQMYFDILRRRTYALTPPGANKGIQTILFQIIDKKVYMMDPYEVPQNSKPFYRTRINEVIWLLSTLAEEGRIKNTEFLMAIHDCVQTVNKEHSYRGAHYKESNPAFTIVSCNFSDNIPFPMWEGSKRRDGGFSGWDDTVKEYSEDDTPWEKKKESAVFRGGNRPSMYFKNKTDADEHCNDVGRTRLLHLSEEKPDILDVSIGGTCGGRRTVLERLAPKEHHKYKYILYAEGNCMWADRSKHQVFGPSAIIKQETPCGQFFEPLMKPLTHYIPTDFFFTDTVDQVKWAREHDAKTQEIVKNANEFAHNFLSLKGIKAYAEVLLQEYTKLLVEPEIKLENGALDVTHKQV